MDGWVTCDFTSFSTVFQSYQDDERLIMKQAVCNGTTLRVENISPRARLEFGTARSAGQRSEFCQSKMLQIHIKSHLPL